MSDDPLSKAAVRWLAAIGGVSLVAFVVLIVWLDPGELVESAGNDGFSKSAIGSSSRLSYGASTA